MYVGCGGFFNSCVVTLGVHWSGIQSVVYAIILLNIADFKKKLLNFLSAECLHTFQIFLFLFLSHVIISFDRIVEDVLDIINLLNAFLDFLFSCINHARLSLKVGVRVEERCRDGLFGDCRVWLSNDGDHFGSRR